MHDYPPGQIFGVQVRKLRELLSFKVDYFTSFSNVRPCAPHVGRRTFVASDVWGYDAAARKVQSHKISHKKYCDCENLLLCHCITS